LIGIDLLLNGEQEFRDPLDLVDHHKLGIVHESSRIGEGRLPGRRPIQVAPLGFPALGDQIEQRALPALTCPGNENDSSVR
jgi:hypothetical protein